jgi:hypothetical protein
VYNYGSSPGQVNNATTSYNYKVVVSGTNIKAYVDSVLKFDIDDSTLSGGTVGLWLEYSAGSEFDNVLVESAGGGAPLVTLRLVLDDDPSDEEPGVTMRTKVYMRNMQ